MSVPFFNVNPKWKYLMGKKKTTHTLKKIWVQRYLRFKTKDMLSSFIGRSLYWLEILLQMGILKSLPKAISSTLMANVWPLQTVSRVSVTFLHENLTCPWSLSFKISEAEVTFPLETYSSSSSSYWRHHYLPRYVVEKPPKHLRCFRLHSPPLPH